jgi:hypothetical protein
MGLSKNVAHCYLVHHTAADALQFTNTRLVAAEPKEVSCKNCSRENILKSFPFCQSFACVHCGTRHTLAEGVNFKQLGQRNRTDDGPDIALGSTGTFNNFAYEVIGYCQKEEGNQYASKWKEYTLFHPQRGFAFLSEYSGNWIFVKERGDAPVLERESDAHFTNQNERFELYNSYNFDVVNASGEFPYNAFNDGEKQAREFISPPEVWIQESNNSEGLTWFFGEHLTAADIKTAFGGDIVLPRKTEMGAVEPKGYVSPGKIWKVGLGAILFLVLVHIITSFSHEGRLVSENTYAFTDGADTVSYIKKDIVLDKWSSNLDFEIFADVDNSWCEVSATLVDAVKGTEYSLQQGVEYYHGYSEGENWSEGNKRETAYLSSIPAGRYDLIIRGQREQKTDYNTYSGAAPDYSLGLRSFNLNVAYNTTNDRNLFLCLIPMVLWPFVHFLIVRNNERRRWYNSPFSPYTYNDEN